jgi:hypothetical protein
LLNKPQQSQQPYAATNPPPGTGGYFQPQGTNKQAFQQQSANTQWSQQQAVMSAEFRQQQEQAYALAQAQSQHKQLQLQQLQQQQQHRHAQQQQAAAYALSHAQSQHRQQQQQHQNQPQHEAYASAHADLRRQLQHHQNPNQLQHHHDPNQSQHHRDPNQSQHHQDPNQPQHEGKKHKKDKESKQSKKEKKRQQQEQQHDNDVWGLGEGWQDLEDDPDDYEDMHDAWGRRVHFSPPHTAPSVAPSTVVENLTVNAFPPNKLGLSTFSNTPSKTLTYAYHGTAASMGNRPAHNNTQDFADFIESKGAAISPVSGAFFGRDRKAKERFHWMFPPDKDERVASLLAWIQSVSYGLGSFGVSRSLYLIIRRLESVIIAA